MSLRGDAAAVLRLLCLAGLSVSLPGCAGSGARFSGVEPQQAEAESQGAARVTEIIEPRIPLRPLPVPASPPQAGAARVVAQEPACGGASAAQGRTLAGGESGCAAATPARVDPDAPAVPSHRATQKPAHYDTSPGDGNLRRMLKRWAPLAGYEFRDEHWVLQRDIPIVATAAFGQDFKSAVRSALESTEYTTSPARACFYANRVLRVVPRQEQCARSQ